MNASLRQSLHRLADTASEPEPSDIASRTWTGGRRLRRRDRLATAALTLGLVASLGGLASVALERQAVAPAERSPGPGAVPAQLHAVPERLVHFDERGLRWADDLGTDDLAIGRAAVAFLSGSPGGGLPVLVGADDGRHHLLDLPGWVGADVRGGLPLSDGPGLSLSPDGHRLAWAYGRPAEGREDYAPVESGIRIADLATGRVRDVDLRPLLTTGQALLAHSLVWSPDGATLGWRAMEMRQWNASGSGTDLPAQLGLVDVGTGRARSVAVPGVERSANLAIAVTDAAELVAVRSDGRLQVWGSGQVRQTHHLRTEVAVTPVAAARADGAELALGSAALVSSVPFVDLDSLALLQRRISADVDDAGVRVQPLGWVDATHVAAVVTSTEETIEQGTPQVVVMTSGRVPDDRASWRVAARWDIPLDGVSVAVDLLGVEEGAPGVTGVEEFPEPQWPWSPERIASTTALVMLVAVAGVLVARRRRSG